jgi:hypothetical protein
VLGKMRGKSKIGFVLLVGIAILILLFSSKFKFEMLPGGGTILSLTQASFTSATAPGGLPSPVWILTISQGGLGQYIQGYISKEQVGQMSGTKPKYDLEINMKWDKLSWEYPIRVSYSSTPIKTYQLITWDDWRGLCLESDANSKCGNWIYYGKFPWSFTCFCIKEVQETSYMGYLDSCNIHSVSTVTLNAGGQTYSATLDTKGEISKVLSPKGNIGPYAYIEWVGNLVKQNCPSKDPYIPFYQNGWKLGDKNNYDNYFFAYNSFKNYMSGCVNGANCEKARVEAEIESVNSYASRFLTDIKKFGEIIYSSSTDKAFVELDASSDVQVPLYTLYVSASWLGIYQPMPKPQIVEAKGVNFKSGEYGFLYVKWENVGDNGNFEVWAECTPPIYTLETTKTVGVSSGSFGEAYIKVGGNVGSRSCQYCTIKVKGVGTNYVDSKTVTVCVDPQKVCNPYTKECSIDLRYIRQCNAEGSDWVKIKDCASDEYCTYIGGEPTCLKSSSKGGTGGGGGLPSEKKKEINWWNVLWSGLAGLLAFLTVGKKALREKDWIGILIALIIGVMIFLIVGWILNNLIKILIGGVLGMVLGGVILYFLGPAILFVVIILMEIIRTVRG